VLTQIYADYAATAPLRSEVREALFSALKPLGNPSSVHASGREAKHLLEEARRQVAALFKVAGDDIIFTSGGTESNNLALRGLIPSAFSRLITTSVEHLSVLQTAKALAKEGAEVHFLPVDSFGSPNLESLEKLLQKGPALVSMAYVNNETGNLMPVSEVGRLVKAAGGVLHVDAVQASAYLHPEPSRDAFDMLSVSAHKLGAMPGVGGLYVRKGLKLRPNNTGGHQERELRGGTENLWGAVAFGAAASLALRERDAEHVRLRALRDQLIERVLSTVQGAHLVGHPQKRAPHIANIRFEGCDGHLTLIQLDLAGICASSGSACATGQLSPSHVLRAMGLSEQDSMSAVRFSFGYGTTQKEIDMICEVLPGIITQVRMD
jgi:cysteine desulfurase